MQEMIELKKSREISERKKRSSFLSNTPQNTSEMVDPTYDRFSQKDAKNTKNIDKIEDPESW